MIKLTESFDAKQWLGEKHPLPKGAHLCVPEIHWSVDHKYVYFTYASLNCRHWISVEEKPDVPAAEFMGGGIKCVREDGSIYYRTTLPFAFWSIKSEASIKRDHRAVYIDRNDEQQVRLLCDYMFVEGWSNPLPPYAEYQEIDGSYGRGFRPHYMKPGDWLVKSQRDRKDIRVLSDEQKRAMEG